VVFHITFYPPQVVHFFFFDNRIKSNNPAPKMGIKGEITLSLGSVSKAIVVSWTHGIKRKGERII